MALTKKALCDEIRRAFGGVRLGNGIGLFEADGVDEYADEATCNAYRKRDEKENWQRIPLEHLKDEGLCYNNAEGMRFHLPAFMIATLERGRHSPVFWLAGPNQDMFALFSIEQREVVREFLLFLKNDPAHKLDRDYIDRALTGPWKK